MTDEELARIEARETDTALCDCEECAQAMRDDLLTLVAEVRRLRGLVEEAHSEGFAYGWNLATGYEDIPYAGRLTREWNHSDARRALNADKIPQDGAP